MVYTNSCPSRVDTNCWRIKIMMKEGAIMVDCGESSYTYLINHDKYIWQLDTNAKFK